MEHKRVDSCHTPRLLRGAGAMTCAPGGQSTIVDFAKGARRHPRGLGDGGDTGDARILGMKTCCVGGRLALGGSLVCLEWTVGFWVLPRHL